MIGYMKSFGVLLLGLQLVSAQSGRNLGVVYDGKSGPTHVAGFGDWGYRGSRSGQEAVENAIKKIHAANPFQLGITLGDNFYPAGVASVTDVIWRDLWENAYNKMGIPFFASLGNHDYDGNPQAEVDYSSKSTTWRMPFRYYTFTAGPIQFFALDTDEGTAGRILFRKPWSDTQAKWLADELEKSKATWKIVYGHHPVYSDGHHGDDKRLIAKLLPILKKYKVDLYLAGHEHDMQHHQRDGMSFVIVGAGGKDVRDVFKLRAEYAASQHGFLDLTATPEKLDWKLRGVDGAALHEGFLTRQPLPASARAQIRNAPSLPLR